MRKEIGDISVGGQPRMRLGEMWRVATTLLALCGLFIMCGAGAGADAILSDNSEGSLDTALVAGGTITAAFDGTISISTTKVITVNTTIDATNHNVTIDGGNAVRHFLVKGGATLSLKNVRLQNGAAQSTDVAGALGGAICITGGTVHLSQCIVSHNAVTGLPGNNAGGGAVYVDNTATFTADHTVFQTNSVTAGSDSKNGHEADGGAVYINHGAATFTVCRFDSNVVNGGVGGGSSYGGLGNYVDYNGGAAFGGALCNGNGALNVSNSTFVKNSAVGGANSVSSHGSNGILPALYGIGSGGAIYSVNHMALTNCTLDQNFADGGSVQGSAIRSDSGYTVSTLVNCTVADNGGAGSQSATALYTATSMALENVLLGRNTGGNGTGTFVDNGGNLSDDKSIAFSLTSSSRTNTQAGLGVLGTYGGFTPTVNLLPGSAAINAGIATGAPALDQRGAARVGAVDIGAFEFAAPVSTVRFDLDGNGTSDILWRNAGTGAVGAWLMQGPQYVKYVSLTPANDPNWSIVGEADFSGDGLNDIVWENSVTGELCYWTMSGAKLAQQKIDLPDPQDTNWHVTAVADFNGDGKPDLLWHNGATGQNVIWLMNGKQYVSTVVLLSVADNNWHVAAVCDFLGDGNQDILFQNQATGQIIIWKMNGAQYDHTILWGAVDTAWQIMGSGKFGGPGVADLLWRNVVTGEVLIWQMNNGAYVATYRLPTTSLEWSIQGMR